MKNNERNIYEFFYIEYGISSFLDCSDNISKSNSIDKVTKRISNYPKTKKVGPLKKNIFLDFNCALKKLFDLNLKLYEIVLKFFENNNLIEGFWLSSILNISILYEELKIEIEDLFKNKNQEQIEEILEVILPFDFFRIKGSQKNFISKYENTIKELINNNTAFDEESWERNIRNWKNNIIPSSKTLEKILNNKENINNEEKKIIQKLFLKRVSWKLWEELDDEKKRKYKKKIKEIFIFLIKFIKILKEILKNKNEINNEQDFIKKLFNILIKNKKKLEKLEKFFTNENIKKCENYFNDLINNPKFLTFIEKLEFKENKKWKIELERIENSSDINDYKNLIDNIQKNTNNIEKNLYLKKILDILNKNKGKFPKRKFERLDKKLRAELEERNIISGEEYGNNINFLLSKLILNFTLPEIEENGNLEEFLKEFDIIKFIENIKINKKGE